MTAKNTPVYLTEEQILKADDLPTEDVNVPEWGGVVLVRGLNGEGRDAYWSSMTVQRGKTQSLDVANATAKLVARCIINPETDAPMFTQNKVHELGQKSGAALNRVFEVASRLSGISDEDMDELGKGSGSTPNGGSTSS